MAIHYAFPDEDITIPYMRRQGRFLMIGTCSYIIMDNFKGQTTDEVFEILEADNIHVNLLPFNTTSQLQPMDNFS